MNQRLQTPLHSGLSALRSALLLAPFGLGFALSALGFSWVVRRSGWILSTTGWQYWGLLVLSAGCTLVTGATAWNQARRRQSARILTAGDVRLLLYAGCAGYVVFLAFFQPFNRVTLVLFWSVYVAVFSLLVQACRQLAGRGPRKSLHRMQVFLFVLCLSGIGVELGLRVVDLVAPSPLLARNESVRRFILRSRLRPGRQHFGFPVNRHGYVDTDPENRFKGRLLIAIGDSMNIGVVPHPFHYTTVCENRLEDLEVYNMGIPGAGPREYGEMLKEETEALHPEAVLICLFIGNDIVDSRRLERRVLLPLLFDRENVLSYLLSLRLWRYFREPGASMNLGEGVGDSTGTPGRALSEDEWVQKVPWLNDPLLEPARFSSATYLQIESQRAEWICRRGDSLTYGALWQCLSIMLDTAGEVPLSFLLIPDEFQVEDPLWEEILESQDNGQEMDRDLPQRLIGQWLRRHDAPYLDLLPVFRSVEPLADGQRHLYHRRDTHLNRRGNRIAGEALAEFLQQQLAKRSLASTGRKELRSTKEPQMFGRKGF